MGKISSRSRGVVLEAGEFRKAKKEFDLENTRRRSNLGFKLHCVRSSTPVSGRKIGFRIIKGEVNVRNGPD